MGTLLVSGDGGYAARKSVSDSLANPTFYWRENVSGTLSLLEAVKGSGVSSFILASSAAVYGQPGRLRAASLRARPGDRAAAADEPLRKHQGRLRAAARRIRTGTRPQLGRTALLNIVGSAGQDAVVLGADLDTPDGTCIRDYIHVSDLAAPHIPVLDHLERMQAAQTFNVGTGLGYSVREVLDEIGAATCARPGAGPPPR